MRVDKKELNNQSKSRPIVLQSNDITVQFGGFVAINRFSFAIEQNELHFLIGPNGAGKTTFLDVVCGKTKISSGSIVFHNKEDLSRLKEFEIVRKGIGRKFQAPSVFPHLTISENLELAMKQNKNLFAILKAKMSRADQEKIDRQLEVIGLQELRHLQASTLSHGQKQWLEIGMVMMQEPDLLMLDEPIAGMTEEEEETTGELLQELKKQCSIIVVEHDMDFVRNFAEKVTVMHEGQLLCDGKMEDVQRNERVQEVYLGRKGEVKHASVATV